MNLEYHLFFANTRQYQLIHRRQDKKYSDKDNRKKNSDSDNKWKNEVGNNAGNNKRNETYTQSQNIQCIQFNCPGNF